jgi:hypothetical protein
VLRQPGKGLLNILPPTDGAFDRLVAGVVMAGHERDPLHDLAAPQLADGGVGSDAVKPGLEGQIGAGGGEGVVGLDEGVLGKVFRHRAVAHHAM